MLLVLPQTEHGERSPVNDGSRGACGPDNNLDRRLPFQCPYGLDLAAQPARCNIKTVWPGRHTIFHEDAREIRWIVQRLDHGTASVNDGLEIALSRHAIAERCAQAVAAEVFDFCDFNHHRDPRSWRAPGLSEPLPHAEERGTRVSKHVPPILRDAARCAAPQDERTEMPRDARLLRMRGGDAALGGSSG
jgi:hypothetical protein